MDKATRDMVECTSGQKKALQKKLNGLKKRLKAMNDAKSNDFIPESPTMPFEASQNYVESIREISIANVEYEIEQTKINMQGCDDMIRKLKLKSE